MGLSLAIYWVRSTTAKPVPSAALYIEDVAVRLHSRQGDCSPSPCSQNQQSIPHMHWQLYACKAVSASCLRLAVGYEGVVAGCTNLAERSLRAHKYLPQQGQAGLCWQGCCFGGNAGPPLGTVLANKQSSSCIKLCRGACRTSRPS